MQNKKRKAGKAIAYSNCQRKMEMHISSARWINEMKVNVRIHSRTHIRACPLFHIFFFAFSHFIWLPVCRVMSLMIFAFIGLMIIAWLLLVWEHMCAFYCTVNAKFSPNAWTRTRTHTHPCQCRKPTNKSLQEFMPSNWSWSVNCGVLANIYRYKGGVKIFFRWGKSVILIRNII